MLWFVVGVVIGILVFVSSSVLIVGSYVVKRSCQMTTATGDSYPEKSFKENNFNVEDYKSKYQIDKFVVSSSFDEHVIPVTYVHAKGSEGTLNNKTVIMVHGMHGNKYSTYPMSEVFLENGYNVLAFDQRSSGENTAPYTMFGYYEKHDVLDCVKYVASNSSEDIGLWGMSFGGITVCNSLKFDEVVNRIKFVVLDCPISSMKDMVYSKIDANGKFISSSFTAFCGNVMNKIKFGFFYEDLDSTKCVANVRVPLVVMNSSTDQVTPYYMGKDIYEASGATYKQLVTFDDCKHADCWINDNSKYRAAVEDLLRNI
ncbi:MAG: alpha/beta hydrolase [Clostridia bacterium]|nr:alpha/beta hydrolase [Clostridia bacterium]